MSKPFKIVGTSIFSKLNGPLCCRLYPETTTLQRVGPPKFSTKYINFKGYVYAFTFENDSFYIQKYIFKTFKISLLRILGGQTPPPNP